MDEAGLPAGWASKQPPPTEPTPAEVQLALALSHQALNDLRMPHVLVGALALGLPAQRIEFLIHKVEVFEGTELISFRPGIPIRVGPVPIRYLSVGGPDAVKRRLEACLNQAAARPAELGKVPVEVGVFLCLSPHLRMAPAAVAALLATGIGAQAIQSIQAFLEEAGDTTVLRRFERCLQVHQNSTTWPKGYFEKGSFASWEADEVPEHPTPEQAKKLLQTLRLRGVNEDLIAATLADNNPETIALLKLLALGQREIEEGRVMAAEDVFARMRARIQAKGQVTMGDDVSEPFPGEILEAFTQASRDLTAKLESPMDCQAITPETLHPWRKHNL